MTNDEKIALLAIHGFGFYFLGRPDNDIPLVRDGGRIKRNEKTKEWMINLSRTNGYIDQAILPARYTRTPWQDISAVSKDLIFELIARDKEEQ